MRTFYSFVVIILLFLAAPEATAQDKGSSPVHLGDIFSHTMELIDGTPKPLSEYKGNVLIIVNVASFCGYTPQYKDLQTIHEKYQSKGLRILAFPANNFGNQEPGTNDEIMEFCDLNYNVTFDMFSKISVKGDDQHPLYTHLTTATDFTGEVKWNFQKYVVDRKGRVVAMFPSKVKPTDKEFVALLEVLLSEES